VEHLVIDRQDDIALVRIERPPANALDRELGAELIAVAEELARDTPRAAVLTGSGAFFSAGLDLKVIPTLEPGSHGEMVMGVNRMVAGWLGLSCPVVCGVNGHAIAGGLVLALCADYRVGCTTGKLGLSEVRVGVPYPAAAIAVVRSELAPPAARGLVLRGHLVEPEEALALGVLDELAEPESVLERSLEVAHELGSLPAETYGRVKRQLRTGVLAEVERIVDTEEDPLIAEGWLSGETERAASRALE
jgi:enoyl-CoA hydratase